VIHFAQVWVQMSHDNSMVSMVTELNVSSSNIDWLKITIHLRSLNVLHFGTVTATRLKLWRRGHLRCLHLPTILHENTTIGFKNY